MVYGIPKKSLIICAFFGDLMSGVTFIADDGTGLSNLVVDPEDVVDRARPDDVAVTLPCFVVFSC